jgi:TRAP-type C4-dicarboxylate transport system substrate-binding protein
MTRWKFPKPGEGTATGWIRGSRSTTCLGGVISLLAACVLAMIPASMPALSQEPAGSVPEIKLSVVVSPLYPMGVAAKAWGDALNESAAGAFDVKLYPGAILARRDPTEEFKSVQSGAIDIAVGSALQWSDAFAPLGVFALPWIAPSNAQLTAVVANGDVRSKLAVALDAAGVALVALAPLRHRDLATQSREIMSPDDLKDLRIRVTGPKLVTDTYIALGARPTGLNLEDARNALASGQLDGQDQAAVALVAARAWATGTRHVVQWGAFGNAMVFVVRNSLWQNWPESTRTKVRNAALKAIESAQASARERAAHDELARNDVSLTRMTPAGHSAFRALVKPVYAAWAPKIGVDLVEAAKKASETAGNISEGSRSANVQVPK